ncbi:MAG: hypothetical protein ABFR82_14050 [Nitrospirota bacterium]
MLRNYFFINMCLVIVIGLLGFKLYHVSAYTVEIPLAAEIKDVKKESIKTKQKEAAFNESSFQIISKMDLFRPSRKPPAVKAEKKVKATPKKNIPRLFGTIILGDIKSAILEDPESKTTKSYRLNESVAGFTVAEILEDKVVLLSGSEKVEVRLRDEKGIKPKKKSNYKSKSRRQSRKISRKPRSKPKPRRLPRSHTSKSKTPSPNPEDGMPEEIKRIINDNHRGPGKF